MAKKSALGKGIASLIGGNTNAASPPPPLPGQQKPQVKGKKKINKKGAGAEFSPTPNLVDISLLKANKDQPRKIFKERELRELSQSIKENGVLSPLLVKEKEGGGLEVIAGERRLRASILAGLKKVPVLVKKGTDKDHLVMSIIENVQREDLNCVEEALAYYQLIRDFKLTQEEVAKKVGKDRSSVANLLRILKLPREVLALLQKDELSLGHAKVLAGIKDRSLMEELAKRASEESLSVRELEDLLTLQTKKTGGSGPQEQSGPWEQLRGNLEDRLGLHVEIKANSRGRGKLALKFSSEDEFNRIYETLLKIGRVS